MIQFGYTILYVENVRKAMTFYTECFGFEQKFLTPENDYGELKTGTTTLAFASKELAASNLPEGFIESRPESNPFAMELGFVTENVEAAFSKAVDFGAVVLQQPLKKPWGQTVAYLRDPEGFLIELCTSME